MLRMHLKFLQKQPFKKQQKQLVILLVIKSPIKLQISRTSPQNSTGTVESDTENIGFDKKIPKEIFIYISRKKTENS